MSESLNMLKTEEGQLNAVFACFGSAAQHAQMFEEALGNFLLAYNHNRPEKMSAEKVEELTQSIQASTMGQLLHELKSLVTFAEEDPRARPRTTSRVFRTMSSALHGSRRRRFRHGGCHGSSVSVPLLPRRRRSPRPA